MPRQENKKKVTAVLERETVDGEVFDVLKVAGKEVVAFHVTNIDSLTLEHTPETMLKAISEYFNNQQ